MIGPIRGRPSCPAVDLLREKMTQLCCRAPGVACATSHMVDFRSEKTVTQIGSTRPAPPITMAVAGCQALFAAREGIT
jgi:hypothetical protein